MLLGTSQLMSHAKHRNKGLDGLLIDFNYTTNWIGPAKIAIYGGQTDIVESMTASSPAQQIITGFDDLAPGEYNTDSDYNSNVTAWNQAWPGSSNPHWSDSKTASLKAWFKFPQSLHALTKILIRLRRPDLYGLPPNPLFSDMTGRFYTPVSVPADLDDYLEIIGSDRTYEYLF
jgi:hypothetical protein